ncbi:hypothetical protein HOLleu_00635 [Holothuria leucospilota]|uniref:Integrase core domain-containing protein n=1 Tax=Holothuria leucospilota TaxID=206669 RepID=A0A9Q1HFY9_HOLLE|nr:hypothetical protein HOLleu_00635 [Holothuria leucospilota]
MADIRFRNGRMARERLIKSYFNQGYAYKEIVAILYTRYNISLSVRQLKRILREHGLYRRKHLDRMEDVAIAIEELSTSGSLLGYRLMHHRIRCSYGLRTNRETVRQILGALDPDGVEARTSRRLRRRLYWAAGPNYIWHIDGNDKLIPYGFAIHGAIDGYSRKVIWLEVGPSNKDPSITAGYFLDWVRKLGGTALRIRMDPGTENGLTAQLHSVLTDGNGLSTFGKSSANQRIECWWSFLKKSFLRWWINLFKDMISIGLLNNADPLHIEGVRYFFGRILQKSLQRVLSEWNSHRIRTVSESESPGGIPDVLYFAPELSDANDYKMACENETVDQLEKFVDRWPNVFPCTPEMIELVNIVMERECNPRNAEEATEMYAEFLLRIRHVQQD